MEIPVTISPEHNQRLGGKYFYGTTLDVLIRAIDPQKRIIDSTKISPSAKRFNYFPSFPGFIEIFGPFFSGLQAAAHYAFSKYDEKIQFSENELRNKFNPVILEGRLPKNIRTRQGTIGKIAETTSLPVKIIYILETDDLSHRMEARLIPPKYRKLKIEDFIEEYINPK